LEEIPSPHVDPSIPTTVEEESHPTVVVGMDVDMNKTSLVVTPIITFIFDNLSQ
jgi:hypothetical protein